MPFETENLCSIWVGFRAAGRGQPLLLVLAMFEAVGLITLLETLSPDLETYTNKTSTSTV